MNTATQFSAGSDAGDLLNPNPESPATTSQLEVFDWPESTDLGQPPSAEANSETPILPLFPSLLTQALNQQPPGETRQPVDGAGRYLAPAETEEPAASAGETNPAKRPGIQPAREEPAEDAEKVVDDLTALCRADGRLGTRFDSEESGELEPAAPGLAKSRKSKSAESQAEAEELPVELTSLYGSLPPSPVLIQPPIEVAAVKSAGLGGDSTAGTTGAVSDGTPAAGTEQAGDGETLLPFAGAQENLAGSALQSCPVPSGEQPVTLVSLAEALGPGWTSVPEETAVVDSPADTSQNVDAQHKAQQVDGLASPESADRSALDSIQGSSSGTSAAQEVSQMKNRLSKDQEAVLRAALPANSEGVPQKGGLKAPTEPGRAGKSARLDPDGIAVANPVRMSVAAPEPAAAAVEVPKAPVASQVYGGIVHEVTIMRRLQPDSLAVVLKPDGQTEILLRLEQRDGQMQATVRCDQDDYSLLNSHWSELRRCLQHQGVRLLDLQPRTDAWANGAGGGFSQRHQKSYSEADKAAAPARFTGTSGAQTSRARKGQAANRLLESWA